MKRLLIITIFLFILWPKKIVEASIDNFEEVYLEKGKFLDDFTKAEYNKYYKKIGKQRMFGWKIYKVNDKTPLVYKRETLFSYYNDGTTPFEYNYEYSYNKTHKTTINYSGNLSVSVKGSEKKFSAGLESKLNWEYGTVDSNETKEKISLKIMVDPGTMVNLFISGKGYLTNGVAKNYSFFITIQKGGFELMKSTSEYQRLEKVKVR